MEWPDLRDHRPREGSTVTFVGREETTAKVVAAGDSSKGERVQVLELPDGSLVARKGHTPLVGCAKIS